LTPPAALEKPFIQIGIFSVEQNAKNTATAMKQQGMIPTVKKQTSSGKTFWRVIVGPAQSKSEISTLLKKIKAAGFTDAYTVTN
jgi:cell division septation protein DedD